MIASFKRPGKKTGSKLGIKIAAALALTVVASLGIALPAMAEPFVRPDISLHISKEITTPEDGTTIPESQFEFVFDQLQPTSGAQNPDGFVLMQTPTWNIEDVIIAFTEGGPATQVSADIFAGIAIPDTIGAGNHYFRVTERHYTNPSIDDPANDSEHMVYSEQVFVVIITVMNAPDGTGTYIAGVATLVPSVSDNNAPVFPEQENIYHWGGAGTTDNEYEGKVDDLHFINEFTRDVGDVDDPAFEITKRVEGDFADMTAPFDFIARLGIPRMALDRPVPFELPVIGRVVDTAGNPVLDDAGQPITVEFVQTSTTSSRVFLSAEFQLRHGERLVIDRLPAGTYVEVTEIDPGEYLPSARVYINGELVGEYNEGPNQGPNLAVGVYELDEPVYVGDAPGRNAVDFLNEMRTTDVTGLFVQGMPFLPVLLIGAAALAVVLSQKQRRRIEQLPVTPFSS